MGPEHVAPGTVRADAGAREGPAAPRPETRSRADCARRRLAGAARQQLPPVPHGARGWLLAAAQGAGAETMPCGATCSAPGISAPGAGAPLGLARLAPTPQCLPVGACLETSTARAGCAASALLAPISGAWGGASGHVCVCTHAVVSVWERVTMPCGGWGVVLGREVSELMGSCTPPPVSRLLTRAPSLALVLIASLPGAG